MKVIGFRSSSKEVRYAILEKIGSKVELLNKSDNKLVFPKGESSVEEKIYWLKREIDTILIKYTPNALALKISEYGTREKASAREASYFDAILMLSAKEKNINFYKFLYANLKTNSKEIKGNAEILTGKTDKYWNEQMAAAIVAANKILTH